MVALGDAVKNAFDALYSASKVAEPPGNPAFKALKTPSLTAVKEEVVSSP